MILSISESISSIQITQRFRTKAAVSSALLAVLFVLTSVQPALAQGPASELSATMPRETAAKVIRWAGTIPQAAGKTVEMHFAIYENVSGGSALWSESQSVHISEDGTYSVLLGVTSNEGLPQILFPSGEPRWIEVRPADDLSKEGGATTGVSISRTLLSAVPYAFKAIDAETLAGRAASDYLTREDLQQIAPSGGSFSPNATPAIAGTGNTNALAYWTNSTTLGSSLVTQFGTNVGVNLTTPGTTLDVNGNTTIRGSIILPANGSATASAGTSSHSIQFGSSTYSSSTAEPVPQTYKLQVFPVGNNTASPSSNLELLFGVGTNTPAATGLSFAPNGRITFAAGQTFPGTSAITNIVTTSPLSGGGTSGSVTLGLNTTTLETTLNGKYPQLATANKFTSTATFGGSVTGNATGSAYSIEGNTATGAGIEGNATGTNGFGVLGVASGAGGIGVYGHGAAISATGTQYRGYGFDAGLWADTNLSYNNDLAFGELTTADDTYASLMYNNAAGNDTLVVYNFNSTTGAPAAQIGGYHGSCFFDNGGSFTCDGTKSAAVSVDNNTRKVALYAMESPENWFEDFGSGQLANGAITVKFEPTFAQTVNVGMDYKVFLTPNGDCKGLYVTNKTANGFEVRELGGGKSAVAFDYRIIARRKGYETVRLADKTKQMDQSRMPHMTAKTRQHVANIK